MMNLLIGELKRTWIQTRRYPAEIIGGVVILTAVFYGIFVSTQYMAGPTGAVGERLDTVVVGYVIWTLVLYIVNDIANNLQLEAQTGTLEQVFLSPNYLGDLMKKQTGRNMKDHIQDLAIDKAKGQHVFASWIILATIS